MDNALQANRVLDVASGIASWVRDEEAKLGDRYGYPVTWPLGTLLAPPATQMEQHRCRCSGSQVCIMRYSGRQHDCFPLCPRAPAGHDGSADNQATPSRDEVTYDE